MNTHLWLLNTPDRFWACQPDPSEEIWGEAIRQTLPLVGLSQIPLELDEFLLMTLGEAQFGPGHWDLGFKKRVYYELKPLLPRGIINLLKRRNARTTIDDFPLKWPVEDRYASFLWKVIENVCKLSDNQELSIRPFWPLNKDFAFVLTHDVETEKGQSFIPRIADLEEELGFRSSFNLVPEGYKIDRTLVEDLRKRGFEIGVHGLKHDGKLFRSFKEFSKRADRINQYLEEFGAVGFRSPLMHRNPEWMQSLQVDYDLSFFDTDPYEPMPGGCMSIWPYFIGHFVELPYTLVQDCTLFQVLGETTPRLWLEKLNFIEKFHGMALLITHPEYLCHPKIWKIYSEFLRTVSQKPHYWHVLPKEMAYWWRTRANKTGLSNSPSIDTISAKQLRSIPQSIV